MADDCGIDTPQFMGDSTKKVCIDKPFYFPLRVNLVDHGWIIGDSIVDYGSQKNIASLGALKKWMRQVSGYEWFEENNRLCAYVQDPSLYGELLTNDSCFVKLFDFNLPFQYNPIVEGITFEDQIVPFPTQASAFDTVADILAWVRYALNGDFKAYENGGENYTLAGFVPCEDVCKYQGRIIRDAKWTCIASNLEFPYFYESDEGFIVNGEVVPFGDTSGVFDNAQEMVNVVNQGERNGNTFEAVRTGDTWSICGIVDGGEYKGIVRSSKNPCCCLIEDIEFPYFVEDQAFYDAESKQINIPAAFNSAKDMANWWTETTGREYFVSSVDGQEFSLCTSAYASCDELPVIIDISKVFTECILTGVEFPLEYVDCSESGLFIGEEFHPFPPNDDFGSPDDIIKWLTDTDEEQVPESEENAYFYWEYGEECGIDICYLTLSPVPRAIVLESARQECLTSDLVFPILYKSCGKSGLQVGDEFYPFPNCGVFESADDLVSFLSSVDDAAEYAIEESDACLNSICYSTFDLLERDLKIEDRETFCFSEVFTYPLYYYPCAAAGIQIGDRFIEFPEDGVFETRTDFLDWLQTTDPQALYLVQTFQDCTSRMCFQPCDEKPRDLFVEPRVEFCFPENIEFPLNYCSCAASGLTVGDRFIEFPEVGYFETRTEFLDWLSSTDPEAAYKIQSFEDCSFRFCYIPSDGAERELDIRYPDEKFTDPAVRYYPAKWTCDDGILIDGEFTPLGTLGGEFADPEAAVTVLSEIDPSGIYSWKLLGNCRYGISVEYCDGKDREILWEETLYERFCLESFVKYPVTIPEGFGWQVNDCFLYLFEGDGDGATQESLELCTGNQKAELYTSTDPNGIVWEAEHLGNGEYSVCAEIPSELAYMYTAL